MSLADGPVVTVPSTRIPSDAGSALKVGVRPEKITITAGERDPGPALNHIGGTVAMTTYIGVSHQYKVEAPGGVVLTVYVQNLGADEAPHPGRAGHAVVAARAHLRGDPAGGTVDGGGSRMTDDRIEPTPEMSRALMRGMTQRRLSRRQLIKVGGVSVGALSLSSILAACGKTETGSGTGTTGATVDFSATPGTEINFANWPLYIDKAKNADGDRYSPSLDSFTKANGHHRQLRRR